MKTVLLAVGLALAGAAGCSTDHSGTQASTSSPEEQSAQGGAPTAGTGMQTEDMSDESPSIDINDALGDQGSDADANDSSASDEGTPDDSGE